MLSPQWGHRGEAERFRMISLSVVLKKSRIPTDIEQPQAMYCVVLIETQWRLVWEGLIDGVHPKTLSDSAIV